MDMRQLLKMIKKMDMRQPLKRLEKMDMRQHQKSSIGGNVRYRMRSADTWIRISLIRRQVVAPGAGFN